MYKRSRPVGPSRSDSFLDTCPTVLVPLVGRVAPTRRAAATRRSERVIPAGPKRRSLLSSVAHHSVGATRRLVATILRSKSGRCWRHRRRQRRPHRVEARRILSRSFGFGRLRLLQPLHHLPALMLVEELPEAAAAGEHARQDLRRAAAAPPSSPRPRSDSAALVFVRCSFSRCRTRTNAESLRKALKSDAASPLTSVRARRGPRCHVEPRGTTHDDDR